jgi:hypothetical protein
MVACKKEAGLGEDKFNMIPLSSIGKGCFRRFRERKFSTHASSEAIY